MREHIRSNVIGYVALFCFAMAGTAGALPGRNTVTSNDIVNGEVKKPDLARNAVTSAKVRNDALTGEDINELTLQGLPASGPAGGDLTGNFPEPQIAAGAVGAPEIASSAVGASELASSSVGTSEVANDSLGGVDIDEFALSVDRMECKPGLVLGFARVKGDQDMPSTPTSSSTWIDSDRTCRALSGYQVTVERDGTGSYVVDFYPPGFPIPLSLAVASADQEGGSACADNFVSTNLLSEGRVAVDSFDNDGDAQDCWLTLVVF